MKILMNRNVNHVIKLVLNVIGGQNMIVPNVKVKDT